MIHAETDKAYFGSKKYTGTAFIKSFLLPVLPPLPVKLSANFDSSLYDNNNNKRQYSFTVQARDKSRSFRECIIDLKKKKKKKRIEDKWIRTLPNNDKS